MQSIERFINRAFYVALLIGFLGLAAADTAGAGTVLYQTGFEAPEFETGAVQNGALAGQGGWVSWINASQNAAQVVSCSAGQLVQIAGPLVASTGPNFYSSEFSESLSNYNAVTAGVPIVSVSADIWMSLGPTASQASFLFGFLVLNDENGAPYETVGVDGHGVVFGQNFASPNDVVIAAGNGTNAFHILRADLNFTSRQVTFYMDAVPFGSMPFNPGAGHLLGSVALTFQSSNPLDSRFYVDNVSVTAGTGIPAGSCALQITSAGPCLTNFTPGIPSVGDFYTLMTTFNLVNAPYEPFRIRFSMGSVVWYSDYLDGIGTGYGYYYYFDWWQNLDGPVPWSITLDPDGVSGSTNRANMTMSGSFTPIPPSVPVQLYDPVTMAGVEQSVASYQPGSGTIANLWVVFGSPSSHGAQNVFTVRGPTNAATIVTAPYGIPVFVVGWTNTAPGTFQQSESFVAQLNSMRVNPTLLRTNTWAAMNALSTNWTQWLAPDSICESTNAQVAAFVQQSLPTNYQTTLTPYDTARALQLAVTRALIYQSPPPYSDAVNSLQAGFADCGGYAALLTASLRYVGIPARRIGGFWQGDSWQNDPQWHIRTEFYLPNTGWLVADACEGNLSEPIGVYSWDFCFAPDANDFVAMDVGDAHDLPYWNFNNLQVPNFIWYGNATYDSYNSLGYLQPLGSLALPDIADGALNLSITNTPDEGTVILQSSMNLLSWLPVATNAASGDALSYSFPATNRPGDFFRVVQDP